MRDHCGGTDQVADVARAVSVVVTTVAEAREPWLSELPILFRSVRENGGRLSGARCICWMVGGEAPSELRKLDVEVRPGRLVHPRIRWLNKLQSLTGPDDVVFLDSDTFVLDDLSTFINGKFRATYPPPKPKAERRRNLDRWWPYIYGATLTRRPVQIPYVSSGVMLVPAGSADQLGREWARAATRLGRTPLPRLRPRVFDQIALAVAVTRCGLELDPLPDEANYRTGADYYPSAPVIVAHYVHNRVLLERFLLTEGADRRPSS